MNGCMWCATARTKPQKWLELVFISATLTGCMNMCVLRFRNQNNNNSRAFAAIGIQIVCGQLSSKTPCTTPIKYFIIETAINHARCSNIRACLEAESIMEKNAENLLEFTQKIWEIDNLSFLVFGNGHAWHHVRCDMRHNGWHSAMSKWGDRSLLRFSQFQQTKKTDCFTKIVHYLPGYCAMRHPKMKVSRGFEAHHPSVIRIKMSVCMAWHRMSWSKL